MCILTGMSTEVVYISITYIHRIRQIRRSEGHVNTLSLWLRFFLEGVEEESVRDAPSSHYVVISACLMLARDCWFLRCNYPATWISNETQSRTSASPSLQGRSRNLAQLYDVV